MDKYIYGPVPSRRLGRSLGIDVVPFKICTYNCIYCQLGPTTSQKITPRPWWMASDIVKELEPKLSTEPDYVTIGGSGEPTLYSGLGGLIRLIKKMTAVPVVVLTNGSLLWKEHIRKRLLKADIVIPSLDAGNSDLFGAVNRPHGKISFESMLQGLIQFRKEFTGLIWLEVFLLAGYNDQRSQVYEIARCADRIQPDRIQLNTVTRPPAENYALGLSREQMEQFVPMFNQETEVIGHFSGQSKHPMLPGQEEVLDLLRRRPCTVKDIAGGMGLSPNEITKILQELTEMELVEIKRINEQIYYCAKT